MKPHDTTVVDRHNVFIAKQRMHRWEVSCTYIVMHRNDDFSFLELSCTCIVTSRSGRQQSKHDGVADLSLATKIRQQISM